VRWRRDDGDQAAAAAASKRRRRFSLPVVAFTLHLLSCSNQGFGVCFLNKRFFSYYRMTLIAASRRLSQAVAKRGTASTASAAARSLSSSGADVLAGSGYVTFHDFERQPS
jgi:hypothetical protein